MEPTARGDPVKVLHVIPDLSPESGGPVTAVLGMITALTKRGVEIRLAATDHGHERGERHGESSIQLFRCLYGPWRWAPGLGQALPGLVRWADVVHIHTIWSYPTWVSAKVCRRLGVPYILRPCGMLDRWCMGQYTVRKQIYLALFERQTILGAQEIHWTSEIEQGSSILPKGAPKGTIVPLGLPPAAYEDLPGPAAFPRRYPQLSGKPLVLFLGRLHPKKQADLLIQGFHGIAREFPEAALVLAGAGERRYAEYLRRLAQHLGLGDRVHFLGLLNRVAVKEALTAARVLVLPSLQENLGFAVAEALAAGCPVVVTPQVALAPDVRRRQAGFVIEPTAEGVAGSLKTLLGDERLAHRMGENGRQCILEHLTWDKAVHPLIALYERVCREAARPREARA